ncbi:MAG: Phenylalanyl-tRNA synthetase beta chain [Nitrosopumilales archaeon]|nr:MAG: Phenylalanyl-tRNA synthetase beta chain [Nitrosopumilales archaeon]
MVKECYKMPVVELELPRLQKLVGKTNRKKIIDTLPFVGLDIESQKNDIIRVEYSPNRPDYSTDFGIALGLQGLLGTKTGIQKLKIKKIEGYQIKVDSSVSKVRPFVTGIVARNGKIDEKVLRQLIVMQEDLHNGIGRRRKKSSIGIHDLDTISFPLTYTTTSRNHKFIPLNSSQENSISEILENTEVGQDYGYILGNSPKVPIIIDSLGNTVSFPPIINSSMTIVTTKTKNLLVEVTGLDKNDVEDMLSVVATVLQSAGFELCSVKISGAKNSNPKFNQRKILINTNFVNAMLGLNISPGKIISALKKCRLEATSKNKNIICTVPRYRFDIFGPMDLVEEVALGYGIENLKPNLSASKTLGQKNQKSNDLNSMCQIMVGLGYMEALNSSLTSKRILYDLTNRDSSNIISVMNSKSQEHTILQDFILAGLLNNLSSNIHEPYPQKLFEIGTIFSKRNPIDEEIHLACVNSHKDANFSEIKSILQSALKTGFNIVCNTKTSTHPTFSKGRAAEIIVAGKSYGIIGEIDSKVRGNFKIREPVVGFELKLSGLIFD